MNENKEGLSPTQPRRELLTELGYEDSVVLDPEYYDEAIIGIGHNGRVIYSYDKLVQVLVAHDDMTDEEAIEWIDYNTIRAIPYMGEKAPIVMYSLPE